MNRMGHPKIDTQIYQLILIKVSELFHKESFIFNKWCQIVEYLCVKNRKKKIQSIPQTDTKINSKGIIDLNGKPKILKLLEENTGENLNVLGLSKYFLGTHP